MNEKKELLEREKELDCLYLLSRLLVTFHGDEEELLQEAEIILVNAMSFPEECTINLVKVQKNDVDTSTGSMVFYSGINQREELSLKIVYSKSSHSILRREENLMESAVEIISDSIKRMRLEKKIESKNQALGELIERLSESKHQRLLDMERQLRALVFPSLERLRPFLPEQRDSQIDEMKKILISIVNPDGTLHLPVLDNLTPRELEICGLLQSGMDSKTMAQTLNISSETVERHRCTIRKKLGISGTGQNLQQYLQNL